VTTGDAKAQRQAASGKRRQDLAHRELKHPNGPGLFSLFSNKENLYSLGGIL